MQCSALRIVSGIVRGFCLSREMPTCFWIMINLMDIYMVSVYFFVIHLCICLPSLCRHHSPVAYYIMFKQFFWTQIFTSILLVFPLHVVSISQTECHMVPQLNTFTINSHNNIYKQHLSIVSVWQLLCCDCVSVEKQGDCIIALSQGSLTLIQY